MRKTHNFVFNGKSEATTMTISSLNLFWQSMPLLTLQLTVYNGKCLVVGFTSTNPLAMTYRSIFVCFLETRYEGDGFYRFHNGQGMGGFRRRIIWLLLSLVMTGLMIWKVIETFQEHNSNPIFTKVIERKVPRERFPSVRICPTGLLQGVPLEQLDSKTNNFVRKLREVDSWTARLAERLTASEDDDMDDEVPLRETFAAIDESQKISTFLPVDLKHMLKGFGHWLQNVRVYLRAKYRNNAPGEPKYLVSRTFQETGFQVFSCQFGETDCFDTLEVMNTRTCIDFNLKTNEKKVRLKAGAGLHNGLRLTLISRTDRNINFATPSIGYRVTIADPEKEIHDIDTKSNQLPADVPFGHYAPLGARTNIALQRHEHHRAKRSKGTVCRSNVGNYKDYDDTRCLVEQEVDLRQLRCKCDTRGYLPCSEKAVHCVKALERNTFDTQKFREKIRKKCPFQCEEIFYRASISTYLLNQRAKRQHELLNVILHNPALTEAEAADIEAFNMSATVLTEINVFLKTSSTTVVSDVSKYLPLDLFSNLGGMIGLFLGMCVVSILQWGELAFDLFCFWLFKRAENDTKVMIDEAEEVGNYSTMKET